MAKQKDVAIAVKGLHKSFKLPHEQHSGLKQAILGVFKRNRKKGYEVQEVLKGLDFEIEKGDFFGIVGRNGSGKSTLLKTLAGIYTPDRGHMQVNGTLVPFIELGVGFNPELTGRENVFLNGALLGFSRDDMIEMYDGIVEFAELERFMDQKLKNYSSGMQVRLAFSIAIRADADILLLDEVLAVGDEAFQRKCFQYFAELKRNKKTVILVTHSMDSVQQFCNKAMLIDKGHDLVVGSPSEIAKIYKDLNSEEVASTGTTERRNNLVEANVNCERSKDTISIAAQVIPKSTLKDAVITFVINRNDGAMVYRWASDDKTKTGSTLTEGKKTNIRLSLVNSFPDGVYDIQLSVKKRDRTKEYAVFDKASKFEIVNIGQHWNIETKSKVGVDGKN